MILAVGQVIMIRPEAAQSESKTILMMFLSQQYVSGLISDFSVGITRNCWRPVSTGPGSQRGLIKGPE